jgi:hypothetical protein
LYPFLFASSHTKQEQAASSTRGARSPNDCNTRTPPCCAHAAYIPAPWHTHTVQRPSVALSPSQLWWSCRRHPPPSSLHRSNGTALRTPDPELCARLAKALHGRLRSERVIFVGQSLSNFLRYSRHSLRKDQWVTRVACVNLSCDSLIKQLTTTSPISAVFLFRRSARVGASLPLLQNHSVWAELMYLRKVDKLYPTFSEKTQSPC